MVTGAGVPWDTCAEAGCPGARIGPAGPCLAHAPPEVLAAVLAAPGPAIDLDGRGAHFTKVAWGRIVDALPAVEGRRQLATARFDRATFDADVSFDDVDFAGEVSMVGAAFNGDARFGGSRFARAADFSEATFGAQAWFVGASFAGPASFRAVAFRGPAWFQRASFSAAAVFDGAVFSKDATITKTSFAEVGSFSGAAFDGHARFEGSTCVRGWRFDGARLRQPDDLPEEVRQAAAATPASYRMADVSALPPPPPKTRRPGFLRRKGMRPAIALAVLVLVAAAAFVMTRPEPAAPGFKDYAFLHTNQRTGAPTRYNPCEPIRWVVNPDKSPPGAMEALDQAFAEVSAATGLTFEKLGTTDEKVSLNLPTEEALLYAFPEDTAGYAERYREIYARPSYQPERYGRDRFAPLLVGWTAFAELDVKYSRAILGVGDSEPRDVGPVGETTTFVSGFVMLNVSAPFLTLKGTIMHELGHVVGLAHVNSREELMFGEAKRQDHWGRGDLEGLRRLGRGAGCVPVPPVG